MSRTAAISLALHATLLFFSGLAFATFLSPPAPAWLLEPQNQAFASLMFRFGGQTTVVLGALAGLLHAMSRLGWRRALALFAVGFSISLAAELTGTTTGYPFGSYSYTTQLGYLIGGRVPFNIPASWFFMLYASLAICGRLLSSRDDSATRWRWAAVAALILTAWDVSMDPAMVATTHWLWHLSPVDGASLGRRIFSSAFFYGMPLTNWLGWLLTGTIVARAMLAIVPPSAWTARVSPSNLPLWLYGANAMLPLLICVGRGMWWAVIFGALAMAIPLVLAALAPVRADEERQAVRRMVGVARG
ncbi:MAG: carotenoid biosynthesis protein [bacterium]